MKILKVAALCASLMGGLAFTGSSFAAANCAGTIKLAIKFPSRCGGKLAFNLNDGSEKFFCTTDNTEAALVLTAQASGAEMLVRLSDLALNSCSENTIQYTTPAYMILTAAE